MENTLNVKVILGSTRQGRFSDKVAPWLVEELKKNADLSIEVLDLRDYDMPFFNEPVSPSFKSEPYKNEAVARFTQKIAEGDAYIIIAPEYNHGMPAVLKNAMDWVYQEWNNKAVGFVSYGTVGGARSVEQLRMVAIELQMAPVREAVQINGELYFPVLFGNGTPAELLSKYGDKAQNMIKQLVWWGRALKQARK